MLRRAIAVAILLVFAVEGTGLARVFHQVAMVSCCCGEHRAAKPCRCKSCPVIKHRRAVDDGDCLHREPPCGGDDERAISAAIFTLSDPPRVPAPSLCGRSPATPIASPQDFSPPPTPPPPETSRLAQHP